ncbi:1-acyl-sn-glycerol-3-phosphate acyltransferase [Waterburya agarophytonicola K14]|uniref:1-acyl-sn-glycerol-3-phosphate acyltransferase n=1 Tax=Waterburya agarophytonicola KI4 TaxID=2874699 RepID=A0A964BV14_9CYAN|nr:1-acyl-sn-glycerol-3-phosphate acyltransferase [Waterburya agarophytonicola]MCC0178355.1 1-acyl-sn-glycerol-3-phosphate acyltransferase [Waterburya agarophytonicola KI4]
MTQLKPQPNSPNLNSELPDELNSRISPWVAKILYPIGCHLVLPLFFGKIQINGQDNIPSDAPVIVAPTHRSRWDALIVPYAVGRLASGRDLRFMVSANEVRGFQGWVIRRMGGFPVNTDRPNLNSVRHSIKLLKQDREMLVIFPEGGIYYDRQIHPLKRGVALIALQAETDKFKRKVKILPVGIRYSEPVPKWGTEVTVDIGSPLTVADYFNDSLRQSSQKLTVALEESLRKLYDS